MARIERIAQTVADQIERENRQDVALGHSKKMAVHLPNANDRQLAKLDRDPDLQRQRRVSESQRRPNWPLPCKRVLYLDEVPEEMAGHSPLTR